MRGVISPSTGQRYPLSMICRIYRLARSSAYAARRPEPSQSGRRGPRVKVSDEQLLALIREVLSGESFTSEGYRKAWARLRFRGIRVGKQRVRRLMRDNRLLAPQRAKKHAHGNPAHTGRIVEERPNRMWGTEMRFLGGMASPVRRPRARSPRDRRVHRPVQPSVDRRTPGLSNTRPGPSRSALRGRMIKLALCPNNRGRYMLNQRLTIALDSSGVEAHNSNASQRRNTQ
jgi:HTH-like domain